MRCLSVWAVLLLVLCGCGSSGPEIVPVRGRVTLDGRPLENADVVFQAGGANRPSSGRTDADGSYQLMYKRGIEGARVFTERLEESTMAFLRGQGVITDGHVRVRSISYPEQPEPLAELRAHVTKIEEDRRTIRPPEETSRQ